MLITLKTFCVLLTNLNTTQPVKNCLQSLQRKFTVYHTNLQTR